MENSFFAFMDEAELRLVHAYPEHTDVFERAVDGCKPLFGYSISDPKPSLLLVQSLFRINLNYLIGAYKAMLQAIPSFSYSGMRAVFEGVIRGYFYLVNEDSAIASYLYMSTGGGIKAPEIEELDIEIMKRVIDQVQDAELRHLCDKMMAKESFSSEDLKVINKLDEPSRKIKNNIGKLYTSKVQKELRSIWSALSRFSHSGFKWRYEDLQLPEDRVPIYKTHFDNLLFLLAANTLMYLEVVELTKVDAKFLGEVFRLLEHYPIFFPNKNGFQRYFKLTSQEAIDQLLGF